MRADESRPATVLARILDGQRPGFLTWLLPILLGCLTVVVYWPAIGNDFVNYDDDVHVTSNAHVKRGLTWENIKWGLVDPLNGNWHPVTVWSHMLDCQLFGLDPRGHHLVSVLLHALNAVLVFEWLRRLTRTTWRSLFVALTFALHPLRVESVAWVAERKDLLSAMFGLLTLIVYARYAETQSLTSRPQDPPQGGSGRSQTDASHRSLRVTQPARFYGLALGFFGLGLMSKPMLVTWPFVMLLLDYWPLRRFRAGNVWRLMREKIPFFVLSIAVSILTFLVQKQADAMEAGSGFGLGERVGNALVSYCRYLGKLFWPTNLAIFYPHPGHWSTTAVLLSAGLLSSISGVVFVLRRESPFLLVGWLWFGGILVPVIGLVQVGDQAMADRYTYMAEIGIVVALTWAASEPMKRMRYAQAGLLATGSCAILCCLLLTRQQLHCWRDSETLFRHTLAVTRNNYLAHNNLGTALAEKGQFDEAITQFQETLGLRPNYARAHYNLGNALGRKGNLDGAISHFRESIRLAPNHAILHNNLANALARKGQIDEAIEEYHTTIRLEPGLALPHNNLGYALLQKGETQQAIFEFREAIRLQPDLSFARTGLARALEMESTSTPPH